MKNLTPIIVGLLALAAFGYTGFTVVYSVAANIGPVDGMITAVAFLFSGACFGKTVLDGAQKTAE
jgi:hypothetical protein